MKRLIYVALVAVTCVAAWQAVAAVKKHPEPANMTTDLARLLNYQPTDGATHGGRVRRVVDPV